jgi:hypothetical protein
MKKELYEYKELRLNGKINEAMLSMDRLSLYMDLDSKTKLSQVLELEKIEGKNVIIILCYSTGPN